MPLDFLLRLLSSLVTIALLGGGSYILYEWYEGELIDNRWLILSTVMLLWSFLGFLPILLFRRPGRDEPKPNRSNRVQRLTRPDGSEIEVEFYGPDTAPTLILTHGWGPDSTAWYYAKKQLTEYRVIVWDLPGLGKSKKPKNRDYSLEKYARDLEAVLTLAGDQPVVLVGHSMGAMILLTFSRLFPEHLGQRVAGLVLVDGTYTNPLQTAILRKLLLALQKPLLKTVASPGDRSFSSTMALKLAQLFQWYNAVNHRNLWIHGQRNTGTA